MFVVQRGDCRRPVIGKLSVVAQMDDIRPEADKLVHVADRHLSARLAHLEHEGDQCTERGARQRTDIFEIEDESLGKLWPDERTKLLAQFGRVRRVGDGTGRSVSILTNLRVRTRERHRERFGSARC